MSKMIYIPGIIMVLFGILILLMPEILVALVASFFIFAGISAIGAARAFSSKMKGGGGSSTIVGMY